MKGVVKIVVVLLSTALWMSCSTYEFPKSPYPRVETFPVVMISASGVTLQGSISQLGESPILNHGFLWGPTDNLYLSSNENVQLGPSSDEGDFEAEINSGWVQGKTYYVRAFVETKDHFVLGEPQAFTK